MEISVTNYLIGNVQIHMSGTFHFNNKWKSFEKPVVVVTIDNPDL